ncbi:hypothetical protein, partial [Nocardia brasiliensis]|uniref:hypothetical protein n=1 Tax=Nocardia brasiliensis TaxID=37326 RepID=UPI002456E95B
MRRRRFGERTAVDDAGRRDARGRHRERYRDAGLLDPGGEGRGRCCLCARRSVGGGGLRRLYRAGGAGATRSAVVSTP